MQYTIQPGDSLHSIAMTYGTTISNLMALNPQISNPDQIYPGEIITVDSQYNSGDQYYNGNQYYDDNRYYGANQYYGGNQYGRGNRSR
jgi:LysM repeat protein